MSFVQEVANNPKISSPANDQLAVNARKFNERHSPQAKQAKARDERKKKEAHELVGGAVFH